MPIRLFAIVGVALGAAAPPPPPPALAPYIKEGRFDPGDYGWMRGAFDGATADQKAQWQQVVQWRNRCGDEDGKTLRETFRQRGVAFAGANLSMGGGLCGELRYATPRGDQGSSWPAFQAAAARARPVAEAIIWSAAIAQAAADSDGVPPGETAQLIARPMTDQVLRSAHAWIAQNGVAAPVLDPAAHGIADGLLWLAIARRDHANTAWLKKLVAASGWPTIAAVGERASYDAWLLVQHADDDPVFQFDMLHLLEPLAARGAVSKRDYAMLYDRVMLKLTGKQRYGVMATCAGGRWQAMALDDPAGVDARRHAMGMSSLSENLERITASSGPCPSEVIPPSSAPR